MYQENDYVIVTGIFGDSCLSSLYGFAVGPSPAPYKFTAKITGINQDGTVNLTAFKRVYDGMVSLHDDGQECKSYPCDKNHHRTFRAWYKPSVAYNVPVYHLGDVIPNWNYNFDCEDSTGFYKS